jgi:transcriptional regulator GlxA family with amidase domain
MQAVLGKSPFSFFLELRVEPTVHLLKTTDVSVEEIVALAGYTAGMALRTLLRRHLGYGVKEI